MLRGKAAGHAGHGRLIARLALTAGLLGLLLILVDRGTVLRTLMSVDGRPLLLAGTLFLAACFVSSGVWLIVLRTAGFSTSLGNSFRLNLIGFFLNTILPTGLGGDLWRAWIYYQQESHAPTDRRHPGARPTLGAAFATVIVERWIAFGALVTLVWLVLPLAVPRLHGLNVSLGRTHGVDAALLVILFAGAVTAAFGLSAFFLSPMAERGRRWLTRHPVAGTTPAVLDALLETLLAYRGKTGRLVVATVLNLLSPIVESLAYWQLSRALGLGVDPLVFLVMTPIVRVMHHFPLTINGAGAQDLALMGMVTAFALSPAQGLALSLLAHASKLCVSALGLPFYVWLVARPSAFGLAPGASVRGHGADFQAVTGGQ